MSYAALGLNYPITLPVVGTQNINVPVDKMATDAINAAWPVLQTRLNAELPKIIAKAGPAIQSQLQGRLLLAGAVILAAIGASAWWVKRG